MDLPGDAMDIETLEERIISVGSATYGYIHFGIPLRQPQPSPDQYVYMEDLLKECYAFAMVRRCDYLY